MAGRLRGRGAMVDDIKFAEKKWIDEYLVHHRVKVDGINLQAVFTPVCGRPAVRLMSNKPGLSAMTPKLFFELSKSWIRWSQICHSQTISPVIGSASMTYSAHNTPSGRRAGSRPAAMGFVGCFEFPRRHEQVAVGHLHKVVVHAVGTVGIDKIPTTTCLPNPLIVSAPLPRQMQRLDWIARRCLPCAAGRQILLKRLNCQGGVNALPFIDLPTTIVDQIGARGGGWGWTGCSRWVSPVRNWSGRRFGLAPIAGCLILWKIIKSGVVSFSWLFLLMSIIELSLPGQTKSKIKYNHVLWGTERVVLFGGGQKQDGEYWNRWLVASNIVAICSKNLFNHKYSVSGEQL